VNGTVYSFGNGKIGRSGSGLLPAPINSTFITSPIKAIASSVDITLFLGGKSIQYSVRTLGDDQLYGIGEVTGNTDVAAPISTDFTVQDIADGIDYCFLLSGLKSAHNFLNLLMRETFIQWDEALKSAST
jgi:hypothetical protein